MALSLSCAARFIAGRFRQRKRRIQQELASRPLARIGQASGAGLLVDADTPFVLALAFDDEGSTERPNEIDAARMKTLERLIGPPPQGWPAEPRRPRYGEGVINEGDLVSVAGSGARELNPAGRSPNFRDPPIWLALRGTDEEPLWISNAPDFGPVGND